MSQKPNKVITRGHEQPPLTYGVQRLHYEFSAILPTLHLTLVSILQGVVFGELLQGIPLPNVSLAQLLNFLLHVYFYLPYVISSLLILLIWKQFVQASVFLLWPLSTIQAGLTYFIALIEFLAFRILFLPGGQKITAISPTMLSGWITGLGCIGIVGGIIRLNNLRIEKIEDYESADLGKLSLVGEIREGILYICLGIVVIIYGLWYDQIIQLSYKVAWAIPWLTLTFLMFIVCIIIQLEIRQISSRLDKYVEGSDLVVSSGVIRYDSEKIDEKDPIQELIQQVEILQTQVQALTEKRDAIQAQKQTPTQAAPSIKISLFTQLAMAISVPTAIWMIIFVVKRLLKRD